MNPEDVARLVTIKDIERYVTQRGFALSKVSEGIGVGTVDVFVKNISFDDAEQLESELKDRIPAGVLLSVRIDTIGGPYRFGI